MTFPCYTTAHTAPSPVATPLAQSRFQAALALPRHMPCVTPPEPCNRAGDDSSLSLL